MGKKEQLHNQEAVLKATRAPLLRRERLIALGRIVCALTALIALILYDQQKEAGWLGVSITAVGVFAYLIHCHHKCREQISQYNANITLTERLLRRFDDTWMQEEADIASPLDPVAFDLDLNGPHSLYNYLSFAATPYGKKRLSALLYGEDDEITSIQRRQAAIAELLSQDAFTFTLMSASARFASDQRHLKEEDLESLIAYAKAQTSLFPKWFLWFSALMVCATMICFVFGWIGILPYGYGALCLLINLVIALIIAHFAQRSLFLLKDVALVLKDYTRFFHLLQTTSFQSTLLQEIKEQMRQGQQGMRHLAKVVELLSLRRNIISYIAFSALFQLDVWCVWAMEHWRRCYGKDLEYWLKAVGELEALLSLSVLAQVKQTYCFPQMLTNESPHCEIVAGMHPLLKQDIAVANSINLDHGTWIITGSNMSGKTTFLRTVGISLMLCRAGAPVCATTMKTTRLKVYTSMRIQDDVSGGVCSFYSELLRIKMMVDACQRKTAMLVLIDEIFKGTNSADRIACAKRVIERLHEPWVITMVSTHDFALCDCEEDPRLQAHNYHFSEYYEQDEIKFDYRLKDGRCTSTNAQALMRLAGIDT